MFDLDACQRREAGLRDFSMMRSNEDRAPARRLTTDEIIARVLAAMPKRPMQEGWTLVTYDGFDKPTAHKVVPWEPA